MKRIGIQGYEGSFHELAARHYYNGNCTVRPAHSFHELVRIAHMPEETDGVVMAIENSIAGSIIPNYTLLLESSLKVIGEIYVRINHHLLVNPGVQISQLKEVHSHHMAIHQCRKFFGRYPEIHLVETADTALSAKEVSENGWKDIGAIASSQAARLYNLEILADSIETVKNNYTRFLILSRDEVSYGHEPNKASVHFRVSHKPGSLMKALEAFASQGINMSKIQSFPVIEEEWRYYIHCDLEFNSVIQYNQAIEQLGTSTDMLRILGVYTKGETII